MSEKTLIDYLEIGGELSLGFDGYLHKTIFCNDLSCMHCAASVIVQNTHTCKYRCAKANPHDVTASKKMIDRLKKSRPELFV